MEAKIEGGEVEAVKYKPNTYNVEFEVRMGLEDDGTKRTLPFEPIDGVVDGEWELQVQPEDAEVDGFKIDICVLSCEERFNAKDGTVLKITVDAVKPDTGATVKWQKITDPTKGS